MDVSGAISVVTREDDVELCYAIFRVLNILIMIDVYKGRRTNGGYSGSKLWRRNARKYCKRLRFGRKA